MCIIYITEILEMKFPEIPFPHLQKAPPLKFKMFKFPLFAYHEKKEA